MNLICEKAYSLKSLDDTACYTECGVHQGNTFLTTNTFFQQEGINFKMIGYDSFTGFPDGIVSAGDYPETFTVLYASGLISEDHYLKAKERTKDFTDMEHLTTEFLADVGKILERCAALDNVTLVDGNFADTMLHHTDDIAVLFLVCDLFRSYLHCLDLLYPFVVSGGVVIFDEYYSLKYPGPRYAVNSFFSDKDGEFEYYITDEGFERWCFVKGKTL